MSSFGYRGFQAVGMCRVSVSVVDMTAYSKLGADAVLVNTALAVARDPGAMAAAFKKGVEAGREAYLAGLGKQQDQAEASSPLTGFLRG